VAAEHLLRVLSLRTFEAGEPVFDYGDPGREYYVVLAGQLAVCVPLRVKISLQQALDNMEA
jgi:CRP-like cAMP-binding protein